ncbi:MAG: microviridin/marinostatin family tricyclic proteinase inhibitor [Symploca sp. SIO2E9]|nr:microviridin/marinostatin family tricyclic proteinase inhibitor [Symploca sp. SIO2E9]
MSKNTTKEIKAVPFFARFLEEQTAQQDQAPMTTLKYPSDCEDGGGW